MNYLIDPKTKEPSVSLTMLTISFVSLLIGCGLEMTGVIKNTSMLGELFYANTALYFSRRFSVGNKSFGTTDDTPKT